MASRGEVVWPPEVTHEIERGAREDSAMVWIRSHKVRCEHSANLETVKGVLRVAPKLIDPDNPFEQADPYVIALAKDISASEGLFAPAIRILTDDFRDKPDKMSLASGAGLIGVPTVPLRAFLQSRGLLR